MLHLIRTIFETLLGRLLPAQGCHRAAGPCPVGRQVGAPTERLAFTPDPSPQNEDVPLVRPYVLTPSEWQEHRVRRTRRRELWSAAHGVAGPNLLRGVEMAAR